MMTMVNIYFIILFLILVVKGDYCHHKHLHIRHHHAPGPFQLIFDKITKLNTTTCSEDLRLFNLDGKHFGDFRKLKVANSSNVDLGNISVYERNLYKSKLNALICKICKKSELRFNPNYKFAIYFHYPLVIDRRKSLNNVVRAIRGISGQTKSNFTVQIISRSAKISSDVFDYLITITNQPCNTIMNAYTLPPYLININPLDCNNVSDVAGLIGYTFGLNYYHTSMARDSYVQVYYQNIKYLYQEFFFKRQNTYIFEYDTNSIMAIQSFRYSSNGAPSITYSNGTLISRNSSFLLSNDDLQVFRCIRESNVS